MADVPVLNVQNIHTFIGQFHILEGVSVTVAQGSITVLLGRNGAGKTTTLRSIMGLASIQSGTVHFLGNSIVGLRPYQIGQLGVGYVPENRSVFTTLTVRENLEVAQRKSHDLEKNIDLIFDLFPDLKKLYHLYGGQLSGGQQQMLAIARALVPDNRLLLIDEPSEGLAPVIIEELMEAIRQLATNTTILLVEQNFIMASKLADQYIIIEEGNSVLAGDMADLRNDPERIQRYLGVA